MTYNSSDSRGSILGFGSIPVAILPSYIYCLLCVSYIIIKWMIKGHFHIRKMCGDVGVAQPLAFIAI